MTGKQKTILLIEDDAALNRLLLEQLRRLGFKPVGVHSLSEADTAIATSEPAVVLLDLRLPDSAGLDAISRFHDICPVVILTAYGSIEQAVQAVQAGATDYLIKPLSASRLEIAIKRAMETADMRRKIELLETQSRGSDDKRMIGESTSFQHVQQLISLVAGADSTVLIQGESGVGKELVALSIHQESERHNQQLVTIDCASLHENLLESELFGHEKGAFTGADRKKEGLIEVAEGGTVFLDEIGEISPTIQAKLLRVLETSKFRRVGGTRDISVNVRFITATNRDLAEWAKEGKFRGDLYYRLSPFVITVPPLRDRREDIVPLARHFLETRKFLRHVKKTLHPSTEKLLAAYGWPGNIRELRNVIERGLLMSANSGVILPQHVSLPSNQGVTFDLHFQGEPTLEDVKQEYMAKVLAIHGGNRTKAAQAMGISERSLYRFVADQAGEKVS